MTEAEADIIYSKRLEVACLRAGETASKLRTDSLLTSEASIDLLAAEHEALEALWTADYDLESMKALGNIVAALDHELAQERRRRRQHASLAR